MSSESIKHVSDASFDQDVLKANKPVLVDFWAEWCGPCKMIAPILDEVSKAYGGRLQVAKINVDENRDVPAKFGIRAHPDADAVQGRPVGGDQGRRGEQGPADLVPRRSSRRRLTDFTQHRSASNPFIAGARPAAIIFRSTRATTDVTNQSLPPQHQRRAVGASDDRHARSGA